MRKSEKSVYDLTENEKKARLDYLGSKVRRLEVMTAKIKEAATLEEATIDALRGLITNANADFLSDKEDRLFLTGTAANLLLEGVKQRGSIKQLADNFQLRVESAKYEIERLERPERPENFGMGEVDALQKEQA